MDNELLYSMNGLANTINNASVQIGNAALTKANRKWVEKMYDRQNQDAIEFWNMTNEYNTPANQLKRMREADLNPMYQGVDSSNATELNPANADNYSTIPFTSMPNPIEGYLDAKLKQAQIDNVNADTSKKKEETTNITYTRQNIIKERDEMDARIKSLLSSADLNDTQKAKIQQFMEYADRFYEAQIKDLENSADLKEWQKNEIRTLLPDKATLQKMSIADFYHKWAKISAEIKHMANQDEMLSTQITWYAISQMSDGWQHTGLSLKNAIILYELANNPDFKKVYDSLPDGIKDEVQNALEGQTGSSKDKPEEPVNPPLTEGDYNNTNRPTYQQGSWKGEGKPTGESPWHKAAQALDDINYDYYGSNYRR